MNGALFEISMKIGHKALKHFLSLLLPGACARKPPELQ
jgi:hypothetical protein